MVALCDHKSVGVIISNQQDEVLLLERARFPLGLAPPAGHVDEYGSYLNAAICEVHEEVGIKLDLKDLSEKIVQRRINNICRRRGGDHHVWTIYTVKVDDRSFTADSRETNGAAWYTASEIRELIDKTLRLKHTAIQDDMPVLEYIWAHLFDELSVPRT